MTSKEAKEITGGLSKPSKMPCASYSISARECRIGSKLRLVPNSVCGGCYARKGNYTFPCVRAAHEKRLASLSHPLWVEAMIVLIKDMGNTFFRWHDSGDIQSLFHLCRIAEVARQLPTVKFWIPTREYGFVSEYVRAFGPLPENLIVRLSGFMIDGPAPKGLAKRLGVLVSSVSTEENKVTCMAYKQGGKCQLCRACWDSTVENVTYPKH
jgi:hypothetical protein